MKLLNLPERAQLAPLVHGVFHDFDHYVTGDEFSTVASDSGSAADSDAAGGVLVILPSDGSVGDNDETYVKGTQEVYKFANGKPLDFQAYVQFAEANTDDANIYIGLMDAVAANSLVDNGAGPKTSGSHIGFFKVDGGTNWKIHASLGATQTSVELTAANSFDGAAKTAGGASYQKLRCAFVPKTSTKADLFYWIDDVLVYKITDFVYTSATEMQIALGAKNGDTNQETLNVDWVYCYQAR